MPTTRKTERCTIEGCDRPQLARGWCNKHWQRWYKHGDPTVLKINKGSGYTDLPSGYRVLFRSGHPNASLQGQILEHRYVMSKALGRPLRPEESVHHRNGDRSDNRLENLEVWVSYQPTGGRVDDLLKWADDILEQYGHLYPTLGL